jgi:NAD(P)H dehydrogenase (quinone)
MSNSALLVTGAAGHLGRRVVELLLAAGAGPVIAVTRRPEGLSDLAATAGGKLELRRGDFDEPASLASAFQGARRALLVSTDALGRPGWRLGQHQRAVEAFAAAGVEHVVYTSMIKPVGSPVLLAPDHAGTEAALAASRLDFTILRNNLYTDLLLGSLPGALASGKLIDARPTGAVAYITREDCARVAAAALAANTTGRATLDVTGPEALTTAAIAALASAATGRPLTHLPVPFEALVAGMVEHGLPRPIAEMYASFDLAAARGDFAGVTDVVERLTGRKPQSVRDFLGAPANHALLAA